MQEESCLNCLKSLFGNAIETIRTRWTAWQIIRAGLGCIMVAAAFLICYRMYLKYQNAIIPPIFPNGPLFFLLYTAAIAVVVWLSFRCQAANARRAAFYIRMAWAMFFFYVSLVLLHYGADPDAANGPAAPMNRAAISAGFYHSSGWNRDYQKIQILTVEDLLNGKEIEMPPHRTTFKQAPREVKGHNHEQKDLFNDGQI